MSGGREREKKKEGGRRKEGREGGGGERGESTTTYKRMTSLYLSQGHTLLPFPPQLSSDADSNVRYGAELLDRLMKDVVSENPHFDIDNFILLLRDRIYTHDGFARQFLISWVCF